MLCYDTRAMRHCALLAATHLQLLLCRAVPTQPCSCEMLLAASFSSPSIRNEGSEGGGKDEKGKNGGGEDEEALKSSEGPIALNRKGLRKGAPPLPPRTHSLVEAVSLH